MTPGWVSSVDMDLNLSTETETSNSYSRKKWLPWFFCSWAALKMPPRLFCQQRGPVTGGGWEKQQMNQAGFLSWTWQHLSRGTHQSKGCLSIVAGFIQVSSSEFPHFEALQVSAGCQAATQELRYEVTPQSVFSTMKKEKVLCTGTRNWAAHQGKDLITLDIVLLSFDLNSNTSRARRALQQAVFLKLCVMWSRPGVSGR